MKKSVIVALLCLCTNYSFSQQMLFDDIEIPGSRSITDPDYWNKTNLFYCFRNYSSQFTNAECETIIQNAFNTWSRYSNFTFTRVNNINLADIEISWEVNSVHGDCPEFEQGTLAHASIGVFNHTPPGYVHFNDLQPFSTDSTQFDLETTALHEIGHVLGLLHYMDPDCLMFPGIVSGTTGIKRDLTYHEAATICDIYSFPNTINGPDLICDEGVYTVEGLPSGYTVDWSLSDSYYNDYCMETDTPNANQCTITKDDYDSMIDATLTAYIKYNGMVVQTVIKEGINAFNDIIGHYTSGNISSDISYTHILPVMPGYNTIILSPVLIGATVSYSTTATIPLYWGFSPYSGEIDVTMPYNSVGRPIVFNIYDTCGNYYNLYLYSQSQYLINISNDGNGITVSLNDNSESIRGLSLDEPWSIEIRNATTGELMATKISTNPAATVSTSGWSKGLYVVYVTVGKEVLKEKVLIN